MSPGKGNLLNINNLYVIFNTYRGTVQALNGIDLWLNYGERLGIVGESGCGKSVTSLAIMGLIDEPGYITKGSINYNGTELIGLSSQKYNEIRGKELTMIFQEPVPSLNPVMKVGYQIGESIQRMYPSYSNSEIKKKVCDVLELVGLEPDRTINLYPHELSGGMAQRVMISIALCVDPKLIIADEPTSALDVTIQAQILKLLNDLVHKYNYSSILITHAMGVAAEFCDTIMVMYAGNSVEYATTETLFHKPLHPYSKGLFNAVPKIGNTSKLATIPGEVPDLVNPPSGCRFHPRCQYVMDRCKKECPPLLEIEDNHYVACYLYKQKG